MSGLEFLDAHPFVRILAAQKARGVILGGALGDALGLYTEFLPADEAKRSYPTPIEPGKTPMRGDSHRDKFTAGDWTDDTDHALLLLLSTIHHYSSHTHTLPSPSTLASDFSHRLSTWCTQGLLALNKPPLGIGQTIATVALNPAFLENPQKLAREKWVRVEIGEKPASNGSLMRTAPLGVVGVGMGEGEAWELAAVVSRTTHGDPRCTLACCVVVGVIRGLLRGEVRGEEGVDGVDGVIERTVAWVKGREELVESLHGGEGEVGRWLKLDEFARYTGRDTTLSDLQLDEGRKIGYIYKCLGAGIITLRMAMREVPSGDTFAKHMRNLVMEGGDADTNGAVAGALLGAWLGDALLPHEWFKNMNDGEWLREKTVRFVAAAGVGDEEGRKSWEVKPHDEDSDVNGGRTLLTKQELDAREKSMVFAVVAKSHARDKAAQAQKSSQKSWNLFK